jgi:hypothetical protein
MASSAISRTVRSLSKLDAIPLALGGLGVGYFLANMAAKQPPEHDRRAYEAWSRHKKDASIALVFGVAGGALLHWMRR